MGAPARDARDRKDGREEFGRDAQHAVGKAAVKVDVRRNALVDLAALRDDLGRELFDLRIEGVLLFEPLLAGELFDRALEDAGARVGDAVHGVAHAVDEPRAVERLAFQEVLKVLRDRLVARDVDVLLHVGEHLIDADVGAAVAGALEGCERRRHRGIGIGARRGDDVHRKGRVVAAAVLGVQDERHIEDLRFEAGKVRILPQHVQDVFRRRVVGARAVDDEGIVVVVEAGRRITVHREDGEFGEKLQTLPHDVGKRRVVGRGVVREEGQNAAHEGVHHVLGGRLHDDVAHEVLGQRVEFREQLAEVAQLLLGGKLAHDEQVRRLFKAEAPLAEGAAHEVLHVVAAVEELAVRRHRDAVHFLRRVDFGNFRKACQNALAVEIAKALFDVVLRVEGGVDAAGGGALFRKFFHFSLDVFRVQSHSLPPFFAHADAKCPPPQRVFWTIITHFLEGCQPLNGKVV